jgi:DNA-binding NarL/FixJ family response regulator
MSTKKTISVSIVDDDYELTEKIATYLKKTSTYRCISSYPSAEEALAHLSPGPAGRGADGHQPWRHERH